MFHQKVYILMVNDKVASSVANYIPTMNKQADLNKT